MKKLLGVIGGMGVQATDYFCRLVSGMQDVTIEQDYLDMLVYYKPSIPDRSAYILRESQKSPLPEILHAAETLEKAGATYLAMPCVTSHLFYDEIVKTIKIPFLNILKETADFIASKGYNKVGLLATTGTIVGGAFTKAINDVGVSVLIPDDEDQAALMDLIYRVKKGEDVRVSMLERQTENLRAKGVQAIVLGCTELSLISESNKCENYIDVMKLLAKAVLR